MGIPVEEYCPVGAGRFHGQNSSKGDSAFKPYSLRPNDTDWPTIVIESGVSDADWWLRKSESQVKIVIIISVKRAPPVVQIESRGSLQ